MNFRFALLAIIVISSAAPAVADEYSAYMQPGWIVFENTKYTENSKIYRRYIIEPVQPGAVSHLPQNVMMFNCRNTPALYDYLTIVVPFDYTVKSWRRDQWRNNISVRFLVNGHKTFDLPAEYLKGEIYVDRTPSSDAKFADIMQADELAISFGNNDRLFFSLPGRVDRFMKEVLPTLGFEEKFGAATFFTTDKAMQDCLAYKARERRRD